MKIPKTFININYTLGLRCLLCLLLLLPWNRLQAQQGDVAADGDIYDYLPAQSYVPANRQQIYLPVSLPVSGTSGEKIIAAALAENSKGPESVGWERAAYPFQLSRYLRPGEAWCSEFVSWIYKVVDSPFTGGSEGGWMLKDSEAIKRWFQKESRFITRNDPAWAGFMPQAGDYIRYNTAAGGHSGIVRYAAGDTLYTVEGNVGNRVSLRVIQDWRNYPEIDGLGARLP